MNRNTATVVDMTGFRSRGDAFLSPKTLSDPTSYASRCIPSEPHRWLSISNAYLLGKL